MITPIQRELLDSLIGEEGIYTTTIQDNEAFNLGTKLLYLERAINQNCHHFLHSLDLLYQPELVGEAKIANLELIRALKFINDMCFNNEVKFSTFGTRDALNHFFGSLGNINPDVFRAEISTIITTKINALRVGHEESVAEQINARELAEDTIHLAIGWREELDLPRNQLFSNIIIPIHYISIFTNQLSNSGTFHENVISMR